MTKVLVIDFNGLKFYATKDYIEIENNGGEPYKISFSFYDDIIKAIEKSRYLRSTRM